MSKELIRLSDCVVKFDDEIILDHLNLYINDKEFLTLLGPSGCGKTTTAGIYASENREVFTILCDEDMRKGDFVREIARKVGFRSAGMRLRDILDTAIERLMQIGLSPC